MSTRVQKGGPIFRPVAKPRARPSSEARHTSVTPAPEVRLIPGTPGPSNAQASAAALMPPPPTVPSRPQTISELAEPEKSQGTAVPEIPPDGHTSRASFRPPIVHPAAPLRSPRPKPPTIASSSNIHPPPFVVRPSIISPQHHQIDSTTVPIVPPSRERPLAVPVVAPVNAPVSQTSVPAVVPESASSSDNATINNSQIDPALLEAVVTALQHAEQNAGSASDVGTAPATISTEMDAAVHVPGNVPQGTQPTEQSQSAAHPENTAETVSRPRRKRTQHNVAPEGDGAIDAEIEEGFEGSPAPKARRGRKRIRAAALTEDSRGESADGEAGSTTKRRRKKISTSRKTKAPPIPIYDPDLDPGEEIDPTSVTMGTLCDDQGRGRVSSKAAQIVSNHVAWRTANREKRARMKAIMEAKKYGANSEDEEHNVNGQIAKEATPSPEEPPNVSLVDAESLEPGPSSAAASDAGRARGDGFDYTQSMATSRYNVQVRIGPNGETIIDEDSLFVDGNEEEDTTGYTHVEESDSTKFVNSATYSKKSRGSRWSAEETELFYDALSQFGENYELISFILPGRDRKACKNKFKAEDKKDPARITYCLKNRIPYDIATLSRMTGKDFSGPTPVIRAPTPINTADIPTNSSGGSGANSGAAQPALKQGSTPSVGPEGEEVLGNVSDLEDDDATDLALAQGLLA